jgi:fibronectin type 3 domain-containing protein
MIVGHMPSAAIGVLPVAHLSRPILHLAVGLPPQNPGGLESQVEDIYNPASPNFHKFITPQEFADRYAPSEADYNTLIQYAQSQGLTVSHTYSNHMVLDLDGSVSAVEKMFQVHEMVYQRSDGSTFYGPDSDPALPSGLPAVTDVEGLDDANPPVPAQGSGPGGTFAPTDLRTAYSFPSNLTGTGQTLGVFELEPYLLSDVQEYETEYGLNVPVQNVILDDVNSESPVSLEADIDVELLMGICPGMSKLIVYEGSNPIDILNRVATDDLVKTMSISWGWTGTEQQYNVVLQQLAAEGVSVFSASLDSGAWTSSVYLPVDQPFVTSVGGTELDTTTPGGAWDSEIGWPESGGGISPTWPIPWYQTSTTTLISSTKRNGPDVSLNAVGDAGFYSQAWEGIGGTSVATPVWSGIAALANEQRAASGLGPIGFLNPALYNIGNSTRYGDDFHDITSGDNGYMAGTGWDAVTGWGSPIVSSLITDLAAVEPATLESQVDLFPFYNRNAVFTTGTSFPSGGGMFNGYAYEEDLLGTNVDWAGTPFYIGPPNQPDGVSNTAITLPAGNYGTMQILATGVDGNQASQTFTINYTDGTHQTFTQSLSDWETSSNNAGEAIAVTTPSITYYTGTDVQTSANLYAYVTSPNVEKTLSSLTLPSNSNVVVLAITLYGGTAPATPLGLNGVAGNGEAILSWTAGANDATSYSVYRGTSSGHESSTPIATGLTTISYTDTTVTNRAFYYYRVAAVNSSGTSTRSGEVLVIPASVTSPPATPTGLTATTSGPSQVSLAWNPDSNATSYNIYRGESSGAEPWEPTFSNVTGTSFTDTGLAVSTYYYTISASNQVGTSPPSNEASAGLDVVAISCGGSTASPYVADTDFSGGAASTGTTHAITTTGLTNPAPQEVYQHGRDGNFTYTIPGLAAGAPYAVRLHFDEYYWDADGARESNVSINGTQVLTDFDIFKTAGGQYIANIQQFSTDANSSGQIAIQFTTVINNALVAGIEIQPIGVTGPPVPTGLAAMAGNAQVVLSWNASTNATSYNVYRGTASGGEATTPVKTAIPTDGYTDTGLTNGVTYYYTVTAVDSNGTSPLSAQVSAMPTTTGPPVPTGLTATPNGDTGVSLTWNSSINATSYNLFRSTVSGGEGTTPYAENLSGTNYSDFGLNYGITYYYTVNAVDSIGSSAQSSQVSVVATDGIPLAPTGLTATAGNQQVALAWTPGNGATSYNIYRATTSNGEIIELPTQTGITTTSNTDTGLTNGTVYYYKVIGVGIGGSSNFSNEANATPTSGSPPPAPTGLTATAGNAQVALNWNADSGAASYNLYRSTTSGGEGTTPVDTGIPAISNPNFTDTQLTNGVTYYYTVAAVNSNGTSTQTSQVSATPTSGSTEVIEINCGGSAASPFVADTDFSGGTTSSVTNTITTTGVTNPAPQAVYKSNRYNAPTYTIGGLTANALYTVRLHFAECYWTASGKREFNVKINGTQVLTDFDIYATAGGEYKANIQQFNTNANSSGQIVITSTNVVDNAQFNGVEILTN